MVTGIEAAGLALGIFPLVLKGVEVYMDGLDTAKDLWHWRRQLRFIYRELQVEFALFESTCERLIEEVGTDGIEGGIMTMMSGDIDCWRESGFDCKLAKHMGGHIAKVFIDQVIELNDCLEEIREKLGLKYSDFGESDPTAHRSRNKTLIATLKHIIKKDETLTRIQKINARIERLAPRRSTALRTGSRFKMGSTIKMYSRLRKHAFNLHAVLQERVAPCEHCTSATHAVSLQLLKAIAENPRDSDEHLKLTVLFSYDLGAESNQSTITWCEVEFEQLEGVSLGDSRENVSGSKEELGVEDKKAFLKKTLSFRRSTSEKSTSKDSQELKVGFTSVLKGMFRSKPKAKSVAFKVETVTQVAPVATSQIYTDMKRIDNFCQAIQQSNPSPASNLCDLGYLDCTSPKARAKHRIKSRIASSYLKEIVPLKTLLEYELLTSFQDRLELGVILACAAMQLHGTVWLKESWGKNDIYFLQTSKAALTGADGKPTTIREPVLKKPLVRRVLDKPREGRTLTPEPTTKRNDGLLRSLGLILIELWYGKEISKMYPEIKDTALMTANDTDDLSDKIARDAGHMYGDAVRRCIRGIDHADRSLENDEFKTLVENNVISQLRTNLKVFKLGLLDG